MLRLHEGRSLASKRLPPVTFSGQQPVPARPVGAAAFPPAYLPGGSLPARPQSSLWLVRFDLAAEVGWMDWPPHPNSQRSWADWNLRAYFAPTQVPPQKP